MTALNPGRRIEAQLTDALRLRRDMCAAEARERALKLIGEVRIADPERVLRAFPHQSSGGMRQRVLIAAAFALEPKIIVADEPTTALDVTVQKQILRLIRRLQEAHKTAVLFVTHDLGWSRRSATGSRSCSQAPSRRALPQRSSPRPSTLIRARSSPPGRATTGRTRG